MPLVLVAMIGLPSWIASKILTSVVRSRKIRGLHAKAGVGSEVVLKSKEVSYS
jgi:hypothetical protein